VSERVLFESGAQIVSTTRVILGGVTYPVSAISSVRI
jgi:hypothetical protein